MAGQPVFRQSQRNAFSFEVNVRGKIWLILAGIFGATAVGMGAYHGHGLAAALDNMPLDAAEAERRMGYVATAYRYQLLHSVVLFCLAAFLRTWPASVLAKLSGLAFVVGIVCFSGSLYGLAFTGQQLFSSLAPLGGFALIVGWLLIAIAGFVVPEPEATVFR